MLIRMGIVLGAIYWTDQWVAGVAVAVVMVMTLAVIMVVVVMGHRFGQGSGIKGNVFISCRCGFCKRTDCDLASNRHKNPL